MDDFSIAAKLIAAVATVLITCGLIGSLGKLTVKMAEAAIEAQEHDQMSRGQFSRQLWRTPAKR
jgi:hypothetical protein